MIPLCRYTRRLLPVTNRGRLMLAFAAALLPLLLAWLAQYGFGLPPCELCMLQRYPYMVILALALAGLLLPKPGLQRAKIMVIILLFIVELGLAAYHSLVEKGLVSGPTACSGSGEAGMSIEQLRAQIMGAELVSCNQPAIEVLGFTMASVNVLYVLGVLGLMVLSWRCNKKECA